jgi:hypothetical protein
VTQRRNFEYRLKRRVVKKIDFIRYLEYEMQLEALRQKRKERLELKKPYSKVNHVGAKEDYAIIRRIHFIFDRAVNKFKGDVDLWKNYIEFSKSTGAKNVLNRLYTRCIQLLPTEPYFWIDAGLWEFQERHNMTSARGKGFLSVFTKEFEYILRLYSVNATLTSSESGKEGTVVGLFPSGIDVSRTHGKTKDSTSGNTGRSISSGGWAALDNIQRYRKIPILYEGPSSSHHLSKCYPR